MARVLKIVWGIFLLLMVAGCIKVELKDEREIPKFYEIALITLTPEGGAIDLPTPTSTSTFIPTTTASPIPSPTSTPIPSATVTSPTPVYSAEVTMNAICRQGPGSSYPVETYLVVGESVQLIGRNLEATWWQVQKSDSNTTCWVTVGTIKLPEQIFAISVITDISAPPPGGYLPSPTLKPRQKPPRATQGVPPSATDTPAPYPYPSP